LLIAFLRSPRSAGAKTIGSDSRGLLLQMTCRVTAPGCARRPAACWRGDLRRGGLPLG
jgi:hypothetical protein